MTTGRINQVTIFEGAGPVGITGPGRSWLRVGESGSPGGRLSPGRQPEGLPRHHPIATTEFPQAESVQGAAGRSRERRPNLNMSPSRGGSPSPVTPRGGYRCTGVPPSASA
jgi:hypothetical protein